MECSLPYQTTSKEAKIPNKTLLNPKCLFHNKNPSNKKTSKHPLELTSLTIKLNLFLWIICRLFLKKDNKKVRWIWCRILTQCRGCLLPKCTMSVRIVQNSQVARKLLHHNSIQCNLCLPHKTPLNNLSSQRYLKLKAKNNNSILCRAYSKHKIYNFHLSNLNKAKIYKILTWAISTQCSKCSPQ